MSTAVNATASHMGQRLCNAHFVRGDRAVWTDLFEGGPNDAISFLGMATSFGAATNVEAAHMFGYCVWGSLFEQLKWVRDTPARTISIRIEVLDGGAPHPEFDVQRATVLFTDEPGRSGNDPEAAIVRLKLRGDGDQEGPRISAFLTNFVRGWVWPDVVSKFASSFRFLVERSADSTTLNPVGTRLNLDGTALNQRVTIELSPGAPPFVVEGVLNYSSSISRAALLIPTHLSLRAAGQG